MSARIWVLGNGGFGTALATHLHRLGHRVRLWGHDAGYTAEIARTRRNPRYLPECVLPASVEVSSEPVSAADYDLVLAAVPTQHLRAVAERLASFLAGPVPIVSCAKGLEQESGLRPTQVLAEVLAAPELYALSGPCHAEELAAGLPASVVLAGRGSHSDPERIQRLLSGESFRVYLNPDLLGVELCGALKNIVAIAAGIADGLALGDNAKAALLTRGLNEMAVFGEALGAERATFYGLAGVGDLITTAVSPHGRNRALGERIGRGATLAEALATTHKVAEGVWTCRSVLARAGALGVEMPITAAVASVLFDGVPPAEAVRNLMTRELRAEG